MIRLVHCLLQFDWRQPFMLLKSLVHLQALCMSAAVWQPLASIRLSGLKELTNIRCLSISFVCGFRSQMHVIGQTERLHRHLGGTSCKIRSLKPGPLLHSQQQPTLISRACHSMGGMRQRGRACFQLARIRQASRCPAMFERGISVI